MLATALAMAPCHPDRFARGDESHRAAQAAAFNLFAHLFIPPHRDGCMSHQAATSIGRPAAFHSGKPSSSRRTLKPARAKLRDGFERQNAVRASAIGDDLPACGVARQAAAPTGAAGCSARPASGQGRIRLQVERRATLHSPSRSRAISSVAATGSSSSRARK